MHTTKYGNRYTGQEWSEMKTQFKAQEEADHAIEVKIDSMIKYLIRQCLEFGFHETQAQTIARLFRSGEFIDANIQFSSKKNQAFVEAMWARFSKAMNQLS